MYRHAVIFYKFEEALRFYKQAKGNQLRWLPPYQDCFLCTTDRTTTDLRIQRYLETTGTTELKDVKERLNVELRTQAGAKRFLQTQAAAGRFVQQL